MNLAFGALLIFIILFPGILFRKGYTSGPYSKKTPGKPFFDELLQSLMPALLLQLTFFLLAENLFSTNIRLDTLYKLLIGNYTDISADEFILIKGSISRFLLYNVLILGFSYGLGTLVRYLITTWKLDLTVPMFRFKNEWYYVLSGKYLDFPSVPGEAAEIELVFVDVLVETKESTVLYCGVLDDFILSKEQDLERIYLSNVYRRKLSDDVKGERPDSKSADDRYYEMPGDLFVIPFAQIKNINIAYYAIEKTSANADKPAAEAGKRALAQPPNEGI